jgi:endogenous inhibitor of DNA gyrase (YacG/DUF329 family)
MTTDRPLMVSCPRCQAETLYHPDNPFRPFCSQRCQLIDLGQWADESHRIPGPPVPPDFEEPDTH